MKKSWRTLVSILFGLAIIGIARIANHTGPGHDAYFGAIRILALTIGILIVVCSLLFFFVRSKIKRIYFLTAMICASVVAIYIWFVSVGFWTLWPKTTNFYDLLANSFRDNQLFLEIKPDPSLLSLPDPYSVEARKARPDIFYIFDGSLYNGKFYLYWGPAPAVLLTAVKVLYLQEVDDQSIVFAFAVGLFIVQSVFAFKIWWRFFRDLPEWTFLLGILVCGLISPTTWMLNQPEIYEASILSGQFFLMGGLLSAAAALDTEPSPSTWRLVLAGTLLSLAIGSRLILIIPVVFIGGMIVVWMMRTYVRPRSRRNLALALTALAVPLIAGAVLLGWYDWARFGSIFESGLRYQLSGIDYRDHFKDIFSIAYIPANLYNYLLTPFKVLRTFPFLKPLSGDRSFALNYTVPGFYYSREKITGLLYAVPFLLFAFVPAAELASKMFKKPPSHPSPGEAPRQLSLAWISSTLLGATLLTIIMIMLYFYCTMRFAADFSPALTVLALIGFWQGYDMLAKRKFLPSLYALIAISVAFVTILMSTLLAISSYTDRINTLNPNLFTKLVEFFAR
jgi:hypothetical protein